MSITVPASTTLPSTAISAGTLTAGVNAANWADTAGSNVGWKGTLAVQQFHIVGTNAWTPGASAVLANNNSGQYTGATQAAAYTVNVTAASAGATTTVAISWSGEEAGSGTATKNAAFAMGTLGMTITFLDSSGLRHHRRLHRPCRQPGDLSTLGGPSHHRHHFGQRFGRD